MNRNRLRPLAIAAIVVATQLALAGSADAGRSTLKLISLLQDSARQLPSENIVYISPDQTSLTLQLEVLSTRKYMKFPRTIVTVIDEAGNREELKSDEDGKITIEDVHAGLYGIAAFNEHAHAATVIAVRVQGGNKDRFDEIMSLDDPNDQKSPPRIVMAVAIGEKLAPLVERHLIDDREVPAVAIDPTVVDQTVGRTPFNYRVQLGKGGVLRGQLITVMRPSSRYSAVKGTRVTVTQNGIPVAFVDVNALGMFQIGGLRPGIHGLIVSGKGGYAAFGFEAVKAENVAGDAETQFRLASSHGLFDGTIMPVALVPPTMIPTIIETVRDHFPDVEGVPEPEPTPALRSPSLQIAGSDPGLAASETGIGGIGSDDPLALSSAGMLVNPLRDVRAARGMGSSGSSGAAVSSGSRFTSLLGLGAAITAPLAGRTGNSSLPGTITAPLAGRTGTAACPERFTAPLAGRTGNSSLPGIPISQSSL